MKLQRIQRIAPTGSANFNASGSSVSTMGCRIDPSRRLLTTGSIDGTVGEESRWRGGNRWRVTLRSKLSHSRIFSWYFFLFVLCCFISFSFLFPPFFSFSFVVVEKASGDALPRGATSMTHPSTMKSTSSSSIPHFYLFYHYFPCFLGVFWDWK